MLSGDLDPASRKDILNTGLSMRDKIGLPILFLLGLIVSMSCARQNESSASPLRHALPNGYESLEEPMDSVSTRWTLLRKGVPQRICTLCEKEETRAITVAMVSNGNVVTLMPTPIERKIVKRWAGIIDEGGYPSLSLSLKKNGIVAWREGKQQFSINEFRDFLAGNDFFHSTVAFISVETPVSFDSFKQLFALLANYAEDGMLVRIHLESDIVENAPQELGRWEYVSPQRGGAIVTGH